eukprot:TRINITY_DN14987_c2_g1_i1.p1 TRINITY_DN14987_c2_g1~~TRINITY_DN14987_c2_g1_i1.p1  ORF type:complete len:142 (+),score=15.30 TRINITY_DN14987_c2_g1_i1:182-607(+)
MAKSHTLEQNPPRGEVDLSEGNDEVSLTDLPKGQTAAISVDGVESESPGFPGPEVKSETSCEKPKSKVAVAWRSLSTRCTRAAKFTSKSLSNVRRNAWFQDASSRDASHPGSQRLRFMRWHMRGKTRVHASFASVVPHEEI